MLESLIASNQEAGTDLEICWSLVLIYFCYIIAKVES